MRCNAAALALLLLAVSNLCIGRALPGRGKYETGSEVLNTALEGSASSHAGVYDPAKAFGSVGKRTIPKLKPGGVDPSPPGSSKGGQTGGDQAGGSGQRGDGQQAPNDQYGGDQGKSPDHSPPSALKSATDPATAPAPPSVETRYTAPKPVGMNEADLAFWKSFDDNPLNLRDSDQLMLWSGDIVSSEIPRFTNALKNADPTADRNFISSWSELPSWDPLFSPYQAAGAPPWKSDGIFSIKFAEVCANHPQPLHILYGSSADDKLPSNAWLTLAELGIVTGPGSKIPVIYRWDKDTVDFNLRLGQEPTYNILWEAGDPPLAPEFLDITKDPKEPREYDLATNSWVLKLIVPDVVPPGTGSPGSVAPDIITNPVASPASPGSITPEPAPGLPTEPVSNPGTPSPPNPERVPDGSEPSSDSGSEAGGCLPCLGRVNCVCM